MALPVRKSNESLFEFQFNDAAIIGKSTLKEWAKLFDISTQEKSAPVFKDVIQVIGKKLHLVLVKVDVIPH